MYTPATCLEQILHNNIIVAQALNTLSLNMDVQVNYKRWEHFIKMGIEVFVLKPPMFYVKVIILTKKYWLITTLISLMNNLFNITGAV